jgi:hypothetical protein
MFQTMPAPYQVELLIWKIQERLIHLQHPVPLSLASFHIRRIQRQPRRIATPRHEMLQRHPLPAPRIQYPCALRQRTRSEHMVHHLRRNFCMLPGRWLWICVRLDLLQKLLQLCHLCCAQFHGLILLLRNPLCAARASGLFSDGEQTLHVAL